MISFGLEPAALELLTPHRIRLMNQEKDLGLPEQLWKFLSAVSANRQGCF